MGCVDRNAEQRSSAKSSNDDYVIPTENRQQPQYDIIQLDHTQSDRDAAAAADQYDTLNPQTLGEQPQYDFISRPQTDTDAAEYVDVN